MCVMGYFIAFSQIGWWWKWMRYIAVSGWRSGADAQILIMFLFFFVRQVHYYNFSTFMTNQYVGSVYTAFCDPSGFPCSPAVNGSSIVGYYDLEQRIYINFIAQIVMIFGYRVIAWAYMTIFIRGKK